MQIIINLILITAGIGLIIFRERYAHFHVKWQNKAWGIKLGEKELKGTRLFLIIFGSLLVALGIWGLIQEL